MPVLVVARFLAAAVPVAGLRRPRFDMGALAGVVGLVAVLVPADLVAGLVGAFAALVGASGLVVGLVVVVVAFPYQAGRQALAGSGCIGRAFDRAGSSGQKLDRARALAHHQACRLLVAGACPCPDFADKPIPTRLLWIERRAASSLLLSGLQVPIVSPYPLSSVVLSLLGRQGIVDSPVARETPRRDCLENSPCF